MRMRGHTWIFKIGRQPITSKQIATCTPTAEGERTAGQRRDLRAQSITVPLLVHRRQQLQRIAHHTTPQREREAQKRFIRGDKSELLVHRHGGHGVLRGAPRRRSPAGRPALRRPPSAQRLPASPPRCTEALPAPCEGRVRGHIGLRRRAHRGPQSKVGRH